MAEVREGFISDDVDWMLEPVLLLVLIPWLNSRLNKKMLNYALLCASSLVVWFTIHRVGYEVWSMVYWVRSTSTNIQYVQYGRYHTTHKEKVMVFCSFEINAFTFRFHFWISFDDSDGIHPPRSSDAWFEIRWQFCISEWADNIYCCIQMITCNGHHVSTGDGKTRKNPYVFCMSTGSDEWTNIMVFNYSLWCVHTAFETVAGLFPPRIISQPRDKKNHNDSTKPATFRRKTQHGRYLQSGDETSEEKKSRPSKR